MYGSHSHEYLEFLISPDFPLHFLIFRHENVLKINRYFSEYNFLVSNAELITSCLSFFVNSFPLVTQSMHTCCLLCHREFKDWGAGQVNGLPNHGSKLAEAVPALSQALLREVPGRKLADAVPSLSQSLLGEVPLWICQSCRKSVEEEERRTVQEQTTQVIETKYITYGD